MAANRIVCVETEHPHRHIIAVGIGDNEWRATRRETVATVRAAIRNGDRYYTVSPSKGWTADVEPYDVYVNGQWIYTIRSTPDAVPDNNLDNLRVCNW
ncbi:MAG: hypothetical protein QOJ29_1304 [Thermoleophilaceae bacterium]|jgi:hypothetical protein|nr:hypothetical protein [Thermoleophilaceae bacterium]